MKSALIALLSVALPLLRCVTLNTEELTVAVLPLALYVANAFVVAGQGYWPVMLTACT